MNDEAVVSKFRETGDPKWFEVLAVRHRDYVYRIVRRHVFDPDDAADLTQEILVKAYFGLHQFRADASFRTWLHRIAVNCCMNYITRRPPESRRAELSGMTDPLPSSGPELRLHVKSCLERLQGEDRVSLVLKYIEDLDHTQIAEMLGISVSASKMRVQRAKERFLRLYYAENDG